MKPGSGRGSWSCIPAPFSQASCIPHFFIAIPNPVFSFPKIHLKMTNFCRQKLINLRCRLDLPLIFCARRYSLLPLERLLGSWRFPEFPTDKQKNLASRAQILVNPASLVAVKSRIPSRYFAFSRIPHRILAKSRIPRIPFQTLWNMLLHNDIVERQRSF